MNQRNKYLNGAMFLTATPWFVNIFISILISWEQFWLVQYGNMGMISIIQTMYAWLLMLSMLICPLMNLASVVLSIVSAVKRKTYFWSIILVALSVMSFVLSLFAWGWFTVGMARG